MRSLLAPLYWQRPTPESPASLDDQRLTTPTPVQLPVTPVPRLPPRREQDS
jgi:hypothetical protein